jgi:WD40 repeat protein
MAFDSTGSLLIWGCNQNIKVWEFKKGILIEKATLIGHKANINCFVFSKKLRWFVSGS